MKLLLNEMKGFDQINARISNKHQITSSDWALDVQKEEQLNHELFSVYSANYDLNHIKGFPPLLRIQSENANAKQLVC